MDLTIELLHLVGDSTDIDSCNSWRMKFIDQQDVSKLIDLINNMVNQDEKEQLQQCSSSSSSIHAPQIIPQAFIWLLQLSTVAQYDKIQYLAYIGYHFSCYFYPDLVVFYLYLN
ncbi:hypothetical protein H4Q26_013261 [Puccinia striiformis f. sp. tritici PST-130]|nr:hypothetical protein H4Q26_013261 [Puccinia striiformis f. sp. tritici PST-130]